MGKTRLIDTIGEPATLELMAEECTELAHACLKLARFERDENPTPKTKDECVRSVTEELADVWVVIGELTQCAWWDSPMFNIQCNSKMKRMRERLKDGNDSISGK